MMDSISNTFVSLSELLTSISSDLLMFIPATGTTLLLAFISLIFGLVLALFFMKLELSKLKVIAWSATGMVTLLRGLPEILIVLGVYNGIPILVNLFLDGFDLNIGIAKWWIQLDIDFYITPFWCGVIALALLYGAYASQTLRGAYLSISTGQIEAAKVLGISQRRTFFRIVLPQMWRFAMPGLANQWLVLLKDTALVSLITVSDIMLQAKSIATRTEAPFTWYMIAALIYLIITLFSQLVIKHLNQRVTRYENRSATC